MKKERPLLSWKLKDYNKTGIEPPDCLLENTQKTEGELMSQEEITIWFKDNHAALTTLKGVDNDLYEDLLECFLKDLEYLASIGSIEKEAIKDLKENLKQ